ncbi:phenylacetate--CoA ligase family protein [Salinispora arenicola]|uniref:phenylacetate--CoA ligase family protein n=1 Tax=Salinispora arenicola TaxID=168697 RepID=UPI00036B06D8|nr:phenylacetate--CoA ligase family protein [Salinispora arenicola]NIL42461.1 phenylacetate--CoA ligase family protein [Salinispora arenicola]
MFTQYYPEDAALAVELRNQVEAFIAGKWDAAMLATHQTRKLREVVAFARDNSPFYRERLVGVTDEVIAALHPGNLRDLPFTTKDDLRRAQFDMLSRPLSDAWIFYETTGTTGVATPCPRTNVDSLHNNTILTAYYRDILGARGSGQVIGISGPSELHSTGDTFGDVCRSLGHAIAKMWPHSPMVGFDRALELMRWLPVTGLFCTPGMAMHLAQRAIDAGLRPRLDFSLDLLLLTGELLSPSLLANIGLLWDAEVHNVLYASQEASVLAAATSDSRLRTAPLINLYEVVDPDSGEPVGSDGAGQCYGELVVTNLYLGAKPLIRYRTGDLVRMTEAGVSAAVPAPSVEVLGRAHDRLTLNGHLISGYDFENLLLGQFRGFCDYQITIKRDDAGVDRVALTLRSDPTIGFPSVEGAMQQCLDELDTPLTVRFGTPGAITGTGAMVSWKAARVIDQRTGQSDEVEAAENIAASRS